MGRYIRFGRFLSVVGSSRVWTSLCLIKVRRSSQTFKFIWNQTMDF